MLTGLIFAVEEAADRPGMPAATLPFGGMTLLEYQVRLLAGARVEQVLVAAGRMTPGLIAAVQRAGRRGVPVEVVQSAEEAAEKIEPHHHVLVIADGLVTTEPVIERMAKQEAVALLVTADAASPSAIERLDMRDSWVGIARVSGAQLDEIARMPADYDFQSALLRVAVQDGAEHVMLTQAWERSGHLVVLEAGALATRGVEILRVLTARRPNWADRFIFTPLARLALPQITGRRVPVWVPSVLGGLFAIGALAASAAGWVGVGSGVAVLAALLFVTGSALAAMMGEFRRASGHEAAILVLAAASIVTAGASLRLSSGDWTPLVLALVAAASQILVERVPAKPRGWWASPAALLLLLAPAAIAGYATAGLALIAGYGFATLGAAIEAIRGTATVEAKLEKA